MAVVWGSGYRVWGVYFQVRGVEATGGRCTGDEESSAWPAAAQCADALWPTCAQLSVNSRYQMSLELHNELHYFTAIVILIYLFIYTLDLYLVITSCVRDFISVKFNKIIVA